MSFPNWCVSEQAVAERSYRGYINNVHYVNPALWDYAWRSSYTDKKPAVGNLPCGFQTLSPYMTASRGHSHSEGGLQRDMFYGLAGFRPDVKRKLAETGLLMPTLVMAFRRGRVDSDAQYLSADGNPFAFVGDEQYFGPGERIPTRSVHRGAEIIAITMQDIPPLISFVACFAHNGAWYSAPGFVTCTMLKPGEARGPGTKKP